MEVASISAEKILSFIQGGDLIDVTTIAKSNPDLLARATTYSLNNKVYHRERLCKAILALITYAPKDYRNVAWALIQMVPFSHLLHIMDVIDKKENTRRLRLAIAVKIANTPQNDIIRAFFISPTNFRKMFSYLYLPREYVNDKKINHPNYSLAYKLSQLSMIDAMKELNLTPADLVRTYKIPLHLVMQWVQTPKEAYELAKISTPDDFVRHARWFRTILGDDEFERIAISKIEKVKDPFSFLSIRQHLEETEALTPKLSKVLEERAEKVLDEIAKSVNLGNLALIVDVSGSMWEALEITDKLYEVFSRMTRITHLIAFREYAFTVSREQLRSLEPDGTTSIGSAILLLAQQLKEKPIDLQAIILVSDLCENTAPYLKDSLKLLEKFGSPPIVVIHCGSRCNLKIDYPHAKIPVDSFHPRLIKDIVANIARLTAKVSEEKEITKVVKERRPILEELGRVELPRRPAETLKPGYLERLLCS
ncbi:vWA domain-containing protein [Archaeoglobus profundus]|uniref:VWA domain-containing protein n=1 Tax=Archaeoglobus profundus (strain DSM 5631 / JCM 9629 / NBRC 100127 / Av18) TaxID=572546 RepID=D2RDL7_ARCPA|nr:vWA domain-containing protein [Archaeoglobus profundus]ADB58211.1 hypothetical protein Arcpr_1156 [Archaeoglobus profundus DSM 5631]